MPLPQSPVTCAQKGIVLPMALIMLVILSFVGLYAAKNSANHEQFSNNLRTTQVSSQAAEAGLRFCERIAIDSTAETGDPISSSADDIKKVITTVLTAPDDANASWRSKDNWKAGAANLITATTSYSAGVDSSAKLANAPTCIVQKLQGDSFVVTARGLSNDAVLDATNGTLRNGAEVWMQSIIAPGNATLFN
jgi:type IV pilus assembly protein PilX